AAPLSVAREHPRAPERRGARHAAYRRPDADERRFLAGRRRAPARRSGRAATWRDRARTARTIARRPGARALRLESDARGGAPRPESRSDPLPDREIPARKARLLTRDTPQRGGKYSAPSVPRPRPNCRKPVGIAGTRRPRPLVRRLP